MLQFEGKRFFVFVGFEPWFELVGQALLADLLADRGDSTTHSTHFRTT